jgi:hypothetical protein
MYGVGTSIEEASLAFVPRELSFIQKVVYYPICMCKTPWLRGTSMRGNFTNVSFLVKQTLGILGSQTKTKHEINLVEMLIDLKQCCF